MIHAEAELFGGAEHAVRLNAADLAALELQPARERGPDWCEGIRLPRLHIGRAADDFEGGATAGIDEAQCQTVGVGVRAHLQHLPDEHVAQVLMDRHDAVDGRDLAGKAIRHVRALQRAAQQGLEPTTGNYHGVRSRDLGVGPSDSRS